MSALTALVLALIFAQVALLAAAYLHLQASARRLDRARAAARPDHRSTP